MTGLPQPEVGLVISYSYLWKEEEDLGHIEGRKDRPCAIILSVDVPDPRANGRKQVAVAPITHTPPRDPNVAVEFPPRIAVGFPQGLPGLDAKFAWHPADLCVWVVVRNFDYQSEI